MHDRRISPGFYIICTSHTNPCILRYDLIDRPGVLGNYVPVNYHSLYDLSVLGEDIFGINRVYTQVRKCPNVKHKCYMV